MSDPFTQVYRALWDIAEASQPLTSLVRVGNRIKLDSTPYTAGPKQTVGQGDLPELQLVLLASSGNLKDTSSTSTVTRQFSFQISTGDKRSPHVLLPVEFALFAALAGWPSVLRELTWMGEHFVTGCNIVTMEHGLSNPELNRGIDGWSSVWTCEVRMHFDQRDLLTYNVSGTGTGSGT